MLRKTFLALAAVASIGLLAPGTASARGGFGGGHGGGFHGGGFHGGGFHGGGGWHGGWRGGGWGWGLGALGAGAVIGYGLYGPYGYYGYPYYDDYYDGAYGGGSNCYIVRRRVHTVHGWRIRRVEMCD